MTETKPRVLHIITGMTVGGAQTLLLDLLPVLSDEYEVELACLYPGRLRPEMEAQGIPVHELDHRRLFSPSTLRGMMKIIKRFRPDIVHTHLGRADLYGRTAARLCGVKHIFTHSHNIDDWKKGAAFNALDNFTIRWAGKVIAVSEEVSHFLLERGVPRDKVAVCYNGVNIERKLTLPDGYERGAWRAQFGFAPEHKVLTIIGRIDEQKGHKYLIPAFARFAAGHPHWRLLIVGGEGRKNAEIETLATASSAADKIIFAGHRGDIPAVLASTDVFILSSLWEGHPMTLMEAMLWERPIVATRVGGIPEVIDHFQNGYLIDPAREDQIEKALAWMDANYDKALDQGRHAKHTAIARYDIRNTADFLRGLYAEALK